jgi:predicted phage-related endonuclease
MNINEIMKELAEYTRIIEDATATADSLRDMLKSYMIEHELDTLTGAEHKATYKPITQARIDGKALKEAMPDVAERFTKSSSYLRFVFT